MGVIRIIENLQNGRYKVELLKDTLRAKLRKAQLEKQIQELTDKNIQLKAKHIDAQAEADGKRDIFMAAAESFNEAGAEIEQLNADLDAKEPVLKAVTQDYDTKMALRNALNGQLQAGVGTAAELAALQTQLNNLDADLRLIQANKEELEQEIKLLIEQIKKLNNPNERIKELEKLSGEWMAAVLKAQGIKSSITFNDLIKTKKQKVVDDYSNKVDDQDIRNAWCVDYALDLEPGETKRVSVDINDENNHILIAPHTYEPTQNDIDEKTLYIAGKIGEKNKANQDAAAKFTEIDDLKVDIGVKRQMMVFHSLQLANIDAYLPITEQKQRRQTLLDQINQLNVEIRELVKKQIKAKQEYDKLKSKETNLGNLILQLNDELQDLKDAHASANQVLIPKVTDRTREFQPTQASSPEAVFYNKSLLPGFQKWKPTYRLGTITAMQDDDLCTVRLEPAESGEQSLNINQAPILTGVKIKYGSCNSAAFNIEDRVVVSFEEREQSKPTVIGFEDNPKPCGPFCTYGDKYISGQAYIQKKSHKREIIENLKAGEGGLSNLAGHTGWNQTWGYYINKSKAISWDLTKVYINGKATQDFGDDILCAALQGDKLAIIFLGSTDIAVYDVFGSNGLEVSLSNPIFIPLSKPFFGSWGQSVFVGNCLLSAGIKENYDDYPIIRSFGYFFAYEFDKDFNEINVKTFYDFERTGASNDPNGVREIWACYDNRAYIVYEGADVPNRINRIDEFVKDTGGNWVLRDSGKKAPNDPLVSNPAIYGVAFMDPAKDLYIYYKMKSSNNGVTINGIYLNSQNREIEILEHVISVVSQPGQSISTNGVTVLNALFIEGDLNILPPQNMASVNFHVSFAYDGKTLVFTYAQMSLILDTTDLDTMPSLTHKSNYRWVNHNYSIINDTDVTNHLSVTSL